MLFIFEELLRSNFRYGRMPGSRLAQRGIVRKTVSFTQTCRRRAERSCQKTGAGPVRKRAGRQEPDMVVSDELYLKEEDQKHGRAYI